MNSQTSIFILFALITITATLLPSCVQEYADTSLTDESGKTPLAYRRLLERGESLLNLRRHREALSEFERSLELSPDRPEAASNKIKALFSMDRYEEAVNFCSESLSKSTDYPELLEWCWASRLEARSSSGKIKSEVRKDIEQLLLTPEITAKHLYAAYRGYYFLKDRQKRASTILETARLVDDMDLKEDVAGALFEEILEANTTENRIRLAECYIRNFPNGRMADHAALIFLRETEKEQGEPDPMRAARSALGEITDSRRLSAGVAYWLIEQEVEPDFAIDLLKRSLTRLESPDNEKKPKYFTKALWQEELDKDRDIYFYLIGRALFVKGDLDSAEETLLDVLKRRRDWTGVHRFLGRIAWEQKRYHEAVEYLRRAMMLGDRHEETGKLLSELLVRLYGHEGETRLYFLGGEETAAFQDVSKASGLYGVQAGRLAWADYNRDGFADLLVDGSRLFRNRGDGSFVEVTDQTGLKAPADANGGIFGDYDNDGILDLFVMAHSGNRLFRNNGKVFQDITESAFEKKGPQRTEAAAWGDLDNDGYLDLYIANYERPGVMRGLCVHDRLFRNDQNKGFTDISQATGIHGDEAMCGRGVVWSDLNNDGRPDIMVANYRLDPNHLWLNNGDEKLVESAEKSGVRGHGVAGAYGHSIAPVAGDLDGNGVIDLVISNLAHPRYLEFSDKSMVLLNTGSPTFDFRDLFHESGIRFEESSADAALADVDNDGDLDIYFTSIYPGRLSHLYLNDGKAHFRDVTWLSGTQVENSWGAAFADYNNDGFPDLAVAGHDGLRLFRNEGNGNHWVKVIIEDERCNRYGVGARIIASYEGGRQVREITAGRGTGNQDALPVILGLGSHKGDVELEVHTLCGDVLKRKLSEHDREVIIRNP